MKVGLIARGEDRGLGILTWEWHRHMAPDRTLLVDMGELAGGFRSHPDRFPGATPALFDGHRFADEDAVRGWLAGLDVVYTAETWYDERLPGWCAEAGVRLVCHVMPEFFKWAGRDDLSAVRWWAPTRWLLGTLPDETTVVPVPVPLDRWPALRTVREPSFLHVAGKRAAGDRNGTSIMLAALARVTQPMEVTITTQNAQLPQARIARCVDLRCVTGGVGDYWRLYQQSALVMPRRYGGLSLPVNEAAGAGLALVMTDTSPNPVTWPIERVEVERWTRQACPAGTVPSAVPSARSLAAALDRLAGDREVMDRARERSRTWAIEHSWEVLRPTITAALEAACA